MARNRIHEGSGPSQRQLRVAELIRRTLSEVLQRGDIHDPELNRLSITVGEVRVSPDLKVATAFVVPLGGEHQDDMFTLLERNRGELRRAVSKNLTLKYSPRTALSAGRDLRPPRRHPPPAGRRGGAARSRRLTPCAVSPPASPC